MIIKQIYPHAILATICIAWGSFAHADENQPRQVSVIGTATTKVTPDLMHWRIQVENKGAELGKVAQAHSRYVAAALDYLKQQKISEKSIQTSGMEFGENWSYQNGKKILEGYRASTEISFKLTELDKYQTHWMNIAGLDNVSLKGVAYDHSERIEYEKQTRIKALKAAKTKADLMASVLDSKVGKPILIEEYQPQFARGNNTVNFARSAEGATASNSSFAPGEISITVRVKVSFQLKDSDY
jgi:uncharacterized protein YggE